MCIELTKFKLIRLTLNQIRTKIDSPWKFAKER